MPRYLKDRMLLGVILLVVFTLCSFVAGRSSVIAQKPQIGADNNLTRKPDMAKFESIDAYEAAVNVWLDTEANARAKRIVASGRTPSIETRGRYQLVINPEMRADTFLIDTETGRIWTKTRYVDLKNEPVIWELNDRADSDGELSRWWSQHSPKEKK